VTTADRSAGRRLVFEDHFDAAELNLAVWLPHYLPAWGSLAATAASYDIHDSCLHLRIPTDQGRWLPQVHPAPLRVSGIQSGNFSGPVGLEDSPERSAEICVTEMFGDAVEPGGSTAVGMGLHSFRDPAVAEDSRRSGCRSTSGISTRTRSTGRPIRSSSSSTGKRSGRAPTRRATRCRG